jgi:hypothetical protein
MTAPYRDDTDSLEARHAALSEELSSVKAKTRELDALKASEVRLEREVVDVQKTLEGRRSRRALPLLESVTIASPCTASWDEMVGDERARFCTHCQKDVFNLSALPRDEAETFLRSRTAEVCVRLYKRTDGTVLTSDCPVGVKRKRRRKAVVAAVGGSLLAAGAFLQVASQRTMGSIAVDSDSIPVMGGTGAVSEVPPPPPPPPPPPSPPRPHALMMGALPMPRKPVPQIPAPQTPKKASKVIATPSPRFGNSR